jgi:hypothetical protein
MILGTAGTSGTGEKRPRIMLRGVAGVADRTLLLLGVAAPGHESSSLSKSFSSANKLWPPGVTGAWFSAGRLAGLLGCPGSSLNCRERRAREARLRRIRILGPEVGVFKSELNDG